MPSGASQEWLDVGATSALPAGGGGSYVGKAFVAVGKAEPPAGSAVSGAWDVVLPGYLETLGVRRIAGRGFTDRDNQTSQPVIILSQSLAGEIIPNESSVGKRVRAGREESFYREVVGVVGDVPYWTLVETKSEVAYVPHGQQGWNTMDFHPSKPISPGQRNSPLFGRAFRLKTITLLLPK